MAKKFKLAASEIRPGLAPNSGCIATDRITVDGAPVGYFYRSPPRDPVDSGWAFLAGDESQAYMDVAGNHGIFGLNTIANYDPRVIPFLSSPVGSAFAFDEKSGSYVEIPYVPDEP